MARVCYIIMTMFLFNISVHAYQMKDNPKFSAYTIGKGTYGNPTIYDWHTGSTLTIGSYCSIAVNVDILLGGEHQTDFVTTYPFYSLWQKLPAPTFESKGDVIIGNDVWIGTGAMILSGVKIGNGAVIAARSVVTKNVPPYAIVGGVPAKLIRYRFSANEIEKLQQIAWWNWSENQIAEALPLMQSRKIKKFIKTYSP